MLVATVKPSFKSAAFFPEFDNLLNSVANRTLGHIAKDFTNVHPAVNIKESEKDFQIQLAAPGLAKEDFALAVEKNLLKVSAKKEHTPKEGEKTWRKEFSFLQFERSFNLPDSINLENIAAAYEQGILTITLEKKPEAAPKNISVA
jgi:HSP20 family protein